MPLLHPDMVDAPKPVNKPRGRPRKAQPKFDPSQPLHPWASTSQPQRAASPSTSYLPSPKAAPMPKRVTSTQPPPEMASAVPPIPTPAFHAQPQYITAVPAPFETLHPQYMRATPAPTPIPDSQYVVPRPKIPTRADLEFLLGGPPKIRARSSTPNSAILHVQQVSRTSVAPTALSYAAGARKSDSAMHYQHQSPVLATPVAGPSRLSASPQTASVAYPPAVALASTQEHRAAQIPGSIAYEWPMGAGEDFDDGLELGAEAIMESDHEEGVENDCMLPEDDDPNDLDFSPSAPPAPKRPRVSQTSEAAAGISSTPPRTGRRSLASSSTGTGKVPGSATKPDLKKRGRGRPRKEFYTEDMREKMKAANEIIAMAREQSEGGKFRLDKVIDLKTRRAMSPEMHAVLLRARNNQLQRDRRERRFRNSAKKQAKQEHTETPRTAKSRREDRGEGEAGSGATIAERARGKVAEWIKMISSDASENVDPDQAPVPTEDDSVFLDQLEAHVPDECSLEEKEMDRRSAKMSQKGSQKGSQRGSQKGSTNNPPGSTTSSRKRGSKAAALPPPAAGEAGVEESNIDSRLQAGVKESGVTDPEPQAAVEESVADPRFQPAVEDSVANPRLQPAVEEGVADPGVQAAIEESNADPELQAGEEASVSDPGVQASVEESVADPEPHASSNGEHKQEVYYFSRFGTVTGKALSDTNPADAIVTTELEGVEGGQLYEAGVVGDEYYFST